MSANENRKKTLSYRRAIFADTKTQITIEDHLAAAHSKISDNAKRSFSIPGHPVIECQKYTKSAESGIFLHIASYTPGEKASIVRHEKEKTLPEIDTTAPPDQSEFMDGDIMLFVSGNNVMLCATTLHEKTAERYMKCMIEAAEIDKAASQFKLDKAGNIDKYKLIKAQGVKSITLSSSISEASVAHAERKTVSSKISGRLMDEVKALLLKDIPQDEIDQAENLNARIELSYDSRRKKSSIGRKALNSVATQIIDDDEDGFEITTLSGETIRESQISLRKSVTLAKYGKSVWRDEAWSALLEYFQELKSGGFTEQ